MKTFSMILAAVAGISMFAMSGNAEASGCRYGGGYSGYDLPPYNGTSFL
ncbi:MAG: hypothetical protein HON04_10190 [Planctomicrobium sp.]|nr:hypothetical protein [Planctomicrobium sp.]